LSKIVFLLKFFSIGKYNTKFYRNRESKYSSFFGGVLSLILYIFLFFMILLSLKGLFSNDDYTMT
jgi:hypothetical protein